MAGLPEREIYDRAQLLYENRLTSAMIDNAPPVVTGYDVDALDERDANEVCRLDDQGAGMTDPDDPVVLRADFGEEVLVEGIAIAGHNIDRAGGCVLQLGIDDGDLGGVSPQFDWEVTTPMWNDASNLLANGGCERYNAITTTDPASGDSQLDDFDVFTGTAWIKANVYDSAFRPPVDPDYNGHYENRVYGEFHNDAALPALAGALTQYCFFKVDGSEVVKARVWLHTKGLTLNDFSLYIYELDGALASPFSTQHVLGTITLDDWTLYEFEHTVQSVDTRYLGLMFDSASEVGSLYFDNCTLTVRTAQSRFTQPDLNEYIVKFFASPVPARFLKLSFNIGSALSPTAETYVQLGRILAGRALSLGMQDSVGLSDDAGTGVLMTQGRSPVEAWTKYPQRTVDLTVKTYRQGAAEEIERVLRGRQSYQMFLSVFSEASGYRGMLCHLAGGGLRTQESVYRDFKSISMSFERES